MEEVQYLHVGVRCQFSGDLLVDEAAEYAWTGEGFVEKTWAVFEPAFSLPIARGKQHVDLFETRKLLEGIASEGSAAVPGTEAMRLDLEEVHKITETELERDSANVVLEGCKPGELRVLSRMVPVLARLNGRTMVWVLGDRAPWLKRDNMMLIQSIEAVPEADRVLGCQE